MELGNRERYASAALFTLALHSSQVDNWVPSFIDVKMERLRSGSSQSVMAAWGCPDPDGFPFELQTPHDMEATTFWGWDSVRSKGMCQRVYRHMGIPERSWPALLSLPEVAGYPSADVKGFVGLVRTYVALLDSSVAATEPLASEEMPSASEGGGIARTLTDLESVMEANPCVEPGEGDEQADCALSSELKAQLLIRALSASGDDLVSSPPAPSQARSIEVAQETVESEGTHVSGTADGEAISVFEPKVGSAPPEALDAGAEGCEGSTPRCGKEQQGTLHPREFLSGCFSLSSDVSAQEFLEPGGGEGGRAAASTVEQAVDHGAAPEGEDKDSRGEKAQDRSNLSNGGKCLVDEPLTMHVKEDHMPGATTSSHHSDVSGSPMCHGGKKAGVFSKLFRRYGKLNDSGDMEDINYELEKEIEDAKLRRKLESEDFADGEDGRDHSLLGSETNLSGIAEGQDPNPEASSMPNFFEEHVHCARTDTPEVLSAVSNVRSSGADTSAEALGVVWELLTATLGVTLDEDVDACPEDVLGDAMDKEATGEVKVDRVHWYDARSRTAIRIVAHWLRVPWRRVSNLEALLATTYMFPQPGETRKTRHWTSSRALKVGAAAIAGGGLLALTGGLAAPAIAVGLGAAWTVVGGTAAQAAAITGLASQAAIMGTMGTHGSYVFGKSMINRTAQVSDFGFCMLDNMEDCELYEPESEASDDSHRPSPAASTNDLPAAGEVGVPAETAHAQQLPAPGTNKPSTWKPFGWPGKSGPRDGEAAESGADPAPKSVWSWKSIGGHKSSSSHGDAAPGSSQAEASGAGPSHRKGGSSGSEGKEGGSHWTWPTFKKSTPKLPTLPAPVNLKPDRCRLAVTIAVNGWVQKMEDFVDPWNVLDGTDCERYAIVWESNRLLRLGSALSTFVGTKVADQTAKWFMQHFWFSGILAATAIPSLIVTSSAVIDNAWTVALNRAESAGKVLANVLMARAHGDRPVKLYGFSMGARLIFYCLLELYSNGCRGIVEDVVLLGTPVSIRETRWAMARSVVSGRFVNGYSSRDWVLGVVYRSSNAFTRRCGGLCAVKVPGIENSNLSSIIAGHTDYTTKLPTILEALNLTSE